MGLGACALFLPVALTAPPQTATASPSVPGPRAKLVFSDYFTTQDWGRPGATWSTYSSAYPNGRTNHEDWKLDRVTPGAVTLVQGGGVQFRATPATRRPAGTWAAGLLTTEPWGDGSRGGNGFAVRPGDYVVVRLRLPDRDGGGGHGAWPGVWTWKDGDNEVDILEWHGETPDLAELVNHVGGHAYAWVRSGLLGFGKWVYVGARFGTRSVTWYLGGSLTHMRAVFSDHQGVPSDWRAYLVVNLSVSSQDGRTPVALTPITSEVSSIRVYR